MRAAGVDSKRALPMACTMEGPYTLSQNVS